jgi:hypothetical protein
VTFYAYVISSEVCEVDNVGEWVQVFWGVCAASRLSSGWEALVHQAMGVCQLGLHIVLLWVSIMLTYINMLFYQFLP